MTIQVRTEIVGGRLQLFCEYSHELLRRVRSFGGKWTGSSWEFPIEAGQRIVEDLFGRLNDPVRVRVRIYNPFSSFTSGWNEIDNSVMLGGYVLASRLHRDDAVKFHADMVVGQVPESGGSTKKPRVDVSDDAEFELWVRRDFAVSHGLKILPALPNASETHPDENSDPTDDELFLAIHKLLECLDASYEWLQQGEKGSLAYQAKELGWKALAGLKIRIGENS